MSRLAKNLVAFDTGRGFADVIAMPTLNIQEVVSDMPDNTAHEYRLEVLVGASTLVNKSVTEQSDHKENVFTNAIRATRRKIVEEAFGEFRPLIYQINEAIHARDWNEANRLTGKLYQQMFEDGL
jgi:hypothetical protein